MNKKLDTVRTKSYPVLAKPAILETAYFEGTEVDVNDTVHLTFYPVDIGKVNLENGKVVACDPTMTYRQESFTTQFATGQFPVQLAVAKVNNSEKEFVGFSRILFSDEPVVKWEFALKKGQKPLSIFGDSTYYYPADGGLGQFMDESSFQKLERLDENARSQVYEYLFAELDKQMGHSRQFANTTFKDINVVAFTSGFGDGRYSTYIGFDKTGKPCRLLTDFGLIEWNKR